MHSIIKSSNISPKSLEVEQGVLGPGLAFVSLMQIITPLRYHLRARPLASPPLRDHYVQTLGHSNTTKFLVKGIH